MLNTFGVINYLVILYNINCARLLTLDLFIHFIHTCMRKAVTHLGHTSEEASIGRAANYSLPAHIRQANEQTTSETSQASKRKPRAISKSALQPTPLPPVISLHQASHLLLAVHTSTTNHQFFSLAVHLVRKYTVKQQQLLLQQQQQQQTLLSTNNNNNNHRSSNSVPTSPLASPTSLASPASATTTTQTMTANKLEEYVIQKRIAAALFGDVLLCSHTPTGDLVAVKRVLLSAAAAQRTLATDKKVRENVALERALYRHLQTRNSGRGHANVLRLREEIEFDGYLYLVFDYCERGELYEIVSASADGKLPQPTARKYMRQIAQGVQFVHESGYAHRDLSLENVLVTKDDVCQVCDLGLAVSAAKVSKETVGKLFYMAPEVLAGVRYDPTKADVWSLGVMLFIMLIGAPPVESAATSDARFRLITAEGVRKLIDRWGLTSSLPAAAIDLVAGMLEADPTQRFTIDMVVNHAFLQPQPQQPQHSASIFRRMPSTFADEILVKQQQMGDGFDATAAASPADASAQPRRQSYIKRTINRILRRRSSKRVMAVPPRQTTVVSECGSTKDCASNGCFAPAA